MRSLKYLLSVTVGFLRRLVDGYIFALGDMSLCPPSSQPHDLGALLDLRGEEYTGAAAVGRDIVEASVQVLLGARSTSAGKCRRDVDPWLGP
ncbi:hypothetical protein GALMADRAFT_223529 [Galerina marginata CBS 339.88]|uniref:Uncharacterized protein n=1 Tax=Galerina marginata (strain CBS 339.88) TaxID=685588 RepID=A0A067TAB4_GALM3|nr:hypothetical protein GALMADRAFT_223529 [Galerina marginata CBS 339.88]